ncbi:MAG: hypothetical protein WKG32_05855 [Gemmatimonadaceae bacterium]
MATDQFPEQAKAEVVRWAAAYTRAVSPEATAHTKRVAFDYLALDQFFQAVRASVPRIGGITSARVDETAGQIVLTVADLGRAEHVRAELVSVSLPAGMLRVDQGDAPELRVNLRSYYRPTYGGFQINYSDSPNWDCSLGVNAYRTTGGTADPSLGKYFMTASHCQPGRGQGGVPGGVLDTSVRWGMPRLTNYNVGQTVDVAPIFSCSYGYCQYADVIVGRYDDSVSSTWVYVARANKVSSPYSTAPTMTGTQSITNNVIGAIVGQTVTKVGRTSGETSGRVIQSCSDSPNANDNIWVLCSQIASLESAGGDSGSPVWLPGASPRPVGILWGGLYSNGWRTYYSPISQVNGALGYGYSLGW